MRKILLFCLLLVAGCGVARAGSFSVDPVRIDLSQQDPTAALPRGAPPLPCIWRTVRACRPGQRCALPAAARPSPSACAARFT